MRLFLVRHGETEWSLARRHTGRTDVPLTPAGQEQARAIGVLLAGHRFDRVVASPLGRALATARLAGFGGRVEVCDALREFDYGDYEGLTTPQIRAMRPDWDLFRDGCPNGETVTDVATRSLPLLDAITGADLDVLLFGHGHQLRILTAAYLGLPLEAARHFVLATGSLSVLGTEHDWRAIEHWNQQGEAL